MTKLICFGLFSLLLCACVSAQRELCDHLDWYQHGYDVAMSGRRLDADPTIGRCESEKSHVRHDQADIGFKSGMAAYCENDHARLVGRQGEVFAYDLCDGKNPAKLKVLYDAGRAQFCLADNAYAYGASGKVYKNVCSAEAEQKWLKPYRDGRAHFLDLAIINKEEHLKSLNFELRELFERRTSLGMENARLDASARPLMLYPPVEGQHYKEETPETTEHMLRRNQLQAEISNINWDISNKSAERDSTEREIEALRAERITL